MQFCQFPQVIKHTNESNTIIDIVKDPIVAAKPDLT